MVGARTIPAGDFVPDADQRVTLYGVPWAHDGEVHVHLLDGDRYARAARSALLPDLDPGLSARFAAVEPMSRAIREFRAALAPHA